MREHAVRRCSVCGCMLSRYNDTGHCGACSRRPQLPPADSLWATAQARQALSRWDVGVILGLYRRHTGATQARIAQAVGIHQSEVSRLERGLKQIRDRQQVLTWTRAFGVPDTLIPAYPGVAEFDSGSTLPTTKSDVAIAAGGSTMADLVLTIADSEAAIEAAIEMWRADIAGSTQPLSDAELAGEVLAWLTSHRRPTAGRAGTGRIGMSDVNAVRATLDMFATLDNEHGGGRARDSAMQFLVDRVEPMLNGSFTDKTGQALYAVACEFTLLVAWMAYDIGDHARARAGFAHALALAEAANDRSLGASVLSAMSHQTNQYGNPRQALVLARAALDGSPTDASPTLHAQFSAMAARAAARIGDRVACERALSAAESALGRTDPNVPAWIAYFDECEFADEVAHCFRDLKMFGRAVESAQACLRYPEQGSPRSRVFSRVVLAEALFGAGEVEQAAEISSAVLPLAASMTSQRTASYLAALRSRAEPFALVPAVGEFLNNCPAQ